MTFIAGRTYLLLDPERYDDEEFGVGYKFVKPAGHADGCYIADCWIINDKNEVHPGYNESPIPVRFDDVVTDPMDTLRRLAPHR